MIQRIQTIWLSLCIILSFLLLNGNLASFTAASGTNLALNFSGFVSVSGKGIEIISRSLIIPAILILLPAASLAGIFLFKKSSLQKIAVWIVVTASLVLYGCVFYYWTIAATGYKCSLIPGIKMILPAIMIILSLLARAGIRKDEQIVKSYDRLR